MCDLKTYAVYNYGILAYEVDIEINELSSFVHGSPTGSLNNFFRPLDSGEKYIVLQPKYQSVTGAKCILSI